MDKKLWELFFDTGEPMCYLLAKAGERSSADPGADAADRKGTEE